MIGPNPRWSRLQGRPKRVAIRLRQVNGVLVALCAARSVEKEKERSQLPRDEERPLPKIS
jgi:hypothetical protein